MATFQNPGILSYQSFGPGFMDTSLHGAAATNLNQQDYRHLFTSLNPHLPPLWSNMRGDFVSVHEFTTLNVTVNNKTKTMA